MTRITTFIASWIGYGWLAVLAVWLAGTIVILTVVYRAILARFGTRIPTIVIFALWTWLCMGIGGRYLGYGPPGGQ